MTDKKLSQLTTGNPVAPTDLFYSAQDAGGGVFNQVKQSGTSLSTFVNKRLLADTTYYISNYSGTLAGGSGYAHGTYLAVPLTYSAPDSPVTGAGATADFVITLTGTVSNVGAGYVPGIYLNVPLIYQAPDSPVTGSGATADITIGTNTQAGPSGNTVTKVYLRPTGTLGYAIGNVLTASAGNLGGSVTTAFTFTITGVGVVTTLRPCNTGSGYATGNVLTASNANFGGSGSGFTFTVSAIGSNSNNGLTTATPWRTLQYGCDQLAGTDQNDFALTIQLIDGVYDGVALGQMPYNNTVDGFTIQGNLADNTKVQILSNSAVISSLFGPCCIYQQYGTPFFFVQFLTFNISQTDCTGYGGNAEPFGFTQFHWCKWVTSAPIPTTGPLAGKQANSAMIILAEGGSTNFTNVTIDGGIWNTFMEYSGSGRHYILEQFIFMNNPVFTFGVWYLTNGGFLELGVPTRNPQISFYGTCTGARFVLAFDPTLLFDTSGLPKHLPGDVSARYRDTASYDGMFMARNGFLTPPRLVSDLPPMPDQFFAGHRLMTVNALQPITGLPVVATPGVVVTISGTDSPADSPPSPAVITWNGHGLTAGTQVVFSTTGVLPAPLVAKTFNGALPDSIYYVLATGLTGNSFQIATTPGGTAINTTSPGSGTHTAFAGKTVPVFSDGINWVVDSARANLLSADTSFYVSNFTGTVVPGSGYTTGIYLNKNFINVTSSGTGGTCDIQVGTGFASDSPPDSPATGSTVTIVRPRATGTGYKVGDVLSVSTSDIGAGTLFTFTITAIGSDTPTAGTTALTPFKTPQYAYDTIAKTYDAGGYNITVLCADGTYVSGLNVARVIPNCPNVNFVGASGDYTKCVWQDTNAAGNANNQEGVALALEPGAQGVNLTITTIDLQSGFTNGNCPVYSNGCSYCTVFLDTVGLTSYRATTVSEAIINQGALSKWSLNDCYVRGSMGGIYNSYNFNDTFLYAFGTITMLGSPNFTSNLFTASGAGTQIKFESTFKLQGVYTAAALVATNNTGVVSSNVLAFAAGPNRMVGGGLLSGITGVNQAVGALAGRTFISAAVNPIVPTMVNGSLYIVSDTLLIHQVRHFGTLPAPSTVTGARAIIDDLNVTVASLGYNGVVSSGNTASGGTTLVPVWSDGAAWRVG